MVLILFFGAACSSSGTALQASVAKAQGSEKKKADAKPAAKKTKNQKAENKKSDQSQRIGWDESALELPQSRRLQKKMAARFMDYEKYRNKKYIGESVDGILRVRTTKGLSKKEAQKVKNLVKAENKDREALYKIIVKAEGYDQNMEKVLREKFFRSYQEWAPKGTYFFLDGRWNIK